jgi:hypothetical protein
LYLYASSVESGNEETAFRHRGQESMSCIRVFMADAHQKQSSQIMNSRCLNSAALLVVITAASSLNDILYLLLFIRDYNITFQVFFYMKIVVLKIAEVIVYKPELITFHPS